MKTKIFATLLLASPFLAHAQAPAAFDPSCMAKMGHHRADGGQHDVHHIRRHGDGPEGMPPFLRGLNLSAAQKDQIFEIKHKQAPFMRDQAKASHQAMDELRQLSLADRYDDARAKSLARSAADAQAEMTLMRVQNDQKIVALLTPEQRQQITAKIAAKPGAAL
jgi:Spy/CpxP family protein refolding chaperone